MATAPPPLLVWPRESFFSAAAVVDERPALRTVLATLSTLQSRRAGTAAGELGVDDASAQVAAALGWPAAQAEL